MQNIDNNSIKNTLLHDIQLEITEELLKIDFYQLFESIYKQKFIDMLTPFQSNIDKSQKLNLLKKHLFNMGFVLGCNHFMKNFVTQLDLKSLGLTELLEKVTEDIKKD